MGKRVLCTWDKERIREKTEKLKKIVKEPRYVCLRCARAAKDKEYLCKPEELRK